MEIKTTYQYLVQNQMDIGMGLVTACKDLEFLIDNNFTEIVRQQSKPHLKEVINKQQLIDRINELFFFYNNRINLVNEKHVITLLEKANQN